MCICMLAGSGCGHDEVAVDTNRFSVLGKVMAEKTALLGNEKNGIVLVVSKNDYNQPTPYGIAFDAFRKALGDKMPVAGTEVVKTPQMLGPGSEPLPTTDFVGLLQKYPSADYFVSFIGVPPLTAAQIAQLPSPRPQVVEVVVHNRPTKAMFANRVVCLVALPKPGAPDALPGGSPGEQFDTQYQLITPETTELLEH